MWVMDRRLQRRLGKFMKFSTEVPRFLVDIAGRVGRSERGREKESERERGGRMGVKVEQKGAVREKATAQDGHSLCEFV
jgi:hypothetical protein